MRRRWIAALLTLPLLVPVTGQLPGFAASPAGPQLPEQASETAREHAEEALARAEALFEERSPAAARRQLARGGREATLALNQLMRAREDLSPADRERADALLARPTAPGGDGIVDYTRREKRPHCGDTICIHYVATTKDAPPDADKDNDGVPNMVEQALTTAESVHDVYVAAGYLPPEPDDTKGDYRGNPKNRIDIYLADVGARGYYGYCTTDPGGSTKNRPAYCVIDDDFAAKQFGTRNTRLENQQVTLAHEYFHAVQFAYDTFEDAWFMEATATWAEDELFDGVNDNRQYLRYGQLKRPGVPLDESAGGLNVYGNWIFFRHLTEEWDSEEGVLPVITREMWELASGRAGDPDHYSTRAIQRVLAQRDTSLAAAYGRFAAANRTPQTSYDEGRAYRRAKPARTWTLGSGARSTGPQVIRLDHLTHRTMRFLPGDGVRRRDWRVRVRIDMPGRRTAPVARLVSTMTDGSLRHRSIRLSRTGTGRTSVSFSSREVESVELVLVNASRRTRCWQFTNWACQGMPRDNNERTDFSARIFRR